MEKLSEQGTPRPPIALLNDEPFDLMSMRQNLDRDSTHIFYTASEEPLDVYIADNFIRLWWYRLSRQQIRYNYPAS